MAAFSTWKLHDSFGFTSKTVSYAKLKPVLLVETETKSTSDPHLKHVTMLLCTPDLKKSGEGWKKDPVLWKSKTGGVIHSGLNRFLHLMFHV